jgi:hypothetical protein
MNNHLLICSCHSTEHQLVFYKNEEEDGFKEVFLHVHLIKRSFWYRLKYALKYLFGYKSRYGAWDEFILHPKHAEDLKSIIYHLEN